MNQAPITDDLSIAEGSPCFILGEVGINHNGDPKLAEEMISAVAEAGAHGVGF